MTRRLMGLYRRSPPVLKAVAGSLFGFRLLRWRYGPETDALVAAALERDSWSTSDWEEWQRARLAELLERAATRVPYYREMWRARRANGDTRPVTELANWPILSKEALRNDPRSFLADDTDPRTLFRLTTSGSTGTPIVTWRSRDTTRAWYALVEARWRAWYGVSRRDRWAIIGGREVVPFERRRPPFWIWNAPLRQLYLSNMHIGRETAAAYLGALARHRVIHLYGYSSSLAELARHAVDLGLQAPRLRAIVSNAEPLTPAQREVLRRAFKCPVYESYGMSEAVIGASECEHGSLHLWPDAGVLEVVEEDSDRAVADGSVGRLICTGLLNCDMPLIRYAVGDRGSVFPGPLRCACGRGLPRLGSLDGRTTDVLTASDGRRVSFFGSAFYDLPVQEAQIVQTRRDEIVVNVVPAVDFAEQHEAELKRLMRTKLGDVEVKVRLVEAIERGPNGKFRAVINTALGTIPEDRPSDRART